MNTAKALKYLSIAVYSLGSFIVLCLGAVALFGSGEAINREAMLPFTWRESAFMGLATGCIPMLLACLAAYKFNGIKTSLHKKRKLALLFLPCSICAACALFIIAILLLGYINMFARNIT
jgi:hypothetical protein